MLVRPSKQNKSSALESLGLKPVIGTNDDLELLTEQASQSDIVFSCVSAMLCTGDNLLSQNSVVPRGDDIPIVTTHTQADSDNLPAMEAILKGMKQRHEKTATQPLLIHTVSPLHSRCRVSHFYESSQSGTGRPYLYSWLS